MTPLDASHWLHLAVCDTLIPKPEPPVTGASVPTGILRDYQMDLILRAAAAMALGYRRILIVLPTGGGKTVMAWALMKAAADTLHRSQFVVHRKELIDQTSDSFSELGLPHEFVAAGRPAPKGLAWASLAGVQSLIRRLQALLPPDLAIIDEAHHATAHSWETAMDFYGERDAFVLGLTATPERLDGKGLGDKFDLMIVGPSTADLIEAGYLSPFDYFAPGIPDLTGIHTTAGDFNRSEVDSLMNDPRLVGDIVEHYRRLAPGMQGIVFGASVEHSRNIARSFCDQGIGAEHVDGSMPTARRRAIVDAHRAGDLTVMTNVDLFGEGFDVPSVSYVGLARPTQSLSLHLQQAGRGLRVAEGKQKAIICDHAGNAFRHGLPDEERTWSLEGRKGRLAAGGGTPADSIPVHQCETCFRVTPSSVRVCPGCDTPFPVKKQAPPKQTKGELAKLERVERAAARRVEEARCATFDDFLKLAIARGYNRPEGWAKVRMSKRSTRR